ncbi:MAG: ATP-dependent zinc protease, partial [Planctomycetes bacterium]|nr:ATP-dependent zinc protease [Planctomycetota bacterium]
MLSILGWREWVRLPTLGTAIKAKIDTGAMTSSVHAFDLREYVDRGCPMVEFSLHPRQRSDEFSVTAVAEIAGR